MRSLLRATLFLLMSMLPASAAGVIPFALTQQIDINGLPLAGCKLNIYQTGTTATLQQIWGDFGLTVPLPNPLTCDQTGRIPNFYLADGTVHVNLTDSGGVVLVDVPVMQVVGPSAGGGGGGTVDPNSVMATGDWKWRQSAEILAGWVKANGTTIGSAASGASQRANADTQALFVSLWLNCIDSICPVSTGRGANGLADFNANKTITLPDMRARHPLGLDQMGAVAGSGRILSSNITFGSVDLPGSTGGESNHVQLLTELVQHSHANTLFNPAHSHTIGGATGTQSVSHVHFVPASTYSTGADTPDHTHQQTGLTLGPNPGGSGWVAGPSSGITQSTQGASTTHTHPIPLMATGVEDNGSGGFATHTHGLPANTGSIAQGTTITNVNQGSSTPAPVLDPFILGTWYIRL